MVLDWLEFRMGRDCPCPLAEGTAEGQQAGRVRQRRHGTMTFEPAYPAVTNSVTETNDFLTDPPGGVKSTYFGGSDPMLNAAAKPLVAGGQGR